ncbi:3-isopropylmalate dehydrogenase [Bathymodiolus thermophilus thioautotrophic gill symbiont]|uniref:3-isopropylmalate dehydrogenase n=1 Tax=Bathymodiolus thermophilus thioautotrophic gill symbiont TaxID=2360 RepID=A0A1J5UD79_9GAMM|nr:3-isopropylmalate dehydrogenase [Bathymodiolus thermophilus thioautotrophic gill symbiont]OIR23885.1 3-isopropylmalate dehydrogenase [Bathymodiolus thermophilus thioautotrophic gill symbiont]
MSKILILPGDGIGQEIVKQALKVIDFLNKNYALDMELVHGLIGGTAYDETGSPLPQVTLDAAKECDSILLGAVGGYQWEKLERDLRPERGLLGLRTEMDLFSNLRPAILYPQLAGASTLKEEVVSGLDLMIVRELVAGIYFGQPRGIEVRDGQKYGFNTATYHESEIRRIGHSAFKIAQLRQGRVCSVDKANVLEVCELWREVMEDVAKDYPTVELSHMYVDNAAMQLVKDPKQFDVMVTSNLFGDVLSDCAAMLTGSIGMLPSASLNGNGFGMYEPIHGSAPDIAGKDIANPLATILSVAMMLRYSLNQADLAEKIEAAVITVLDQGYRTQDIASKGSSVVGTSKMGDLVVEALA